MKALSATVLGLIAVATPLPAGEMFYTQRSTSTLTTANLDGTDVQSLIPSAGSNIRGVAIDTATDDLFYAENGANIIYRSRLDGSSRVAIVSTGLNFPADVALDRSGKKVYWCDRNNNRIERADYDGSSRQTVVTTSEPYYLDLDLENGKLYWGDFDAGNLFRANLADGSGLETFVSTNVETRGVKVDSAGGYVYWCDRDSHKVQRRPIAGGAIEDLHTNLDTPHGLTLDIPAGKLYWTDTGTNGIGGIGAKAISRGNMDGSGSPEVLVATSGAWDLTLDTIVTTYGEWTQRHFPKNSPDVSPDADPDRDRLSNLVEYFADLDPFTDQGIPAVRLVDLGGDLSTVYRKTIQPITDVTGIPEFSSNLGSWDSGPTVSQEIAVGVGFEPAPVLLVVERPLPEFPHGGAVFSRVRLELDTQ